MSDADVIAAMRQFGGGFIQGLARLWPLADDVNRERLKAAFPDYWEKYRELARMLPESK